MWTNSEHIWGCCIIKEPETVYVFLGQSSEENTKKSFGAAAVSAFLLTTPSTPPLWTRQSVSSYAHKCMHRPTTTELHKTAPSHSYRARPALQISEKCQKNNVQLPHTALSLFPNNFLLKGYQDYSNKSCVDCISTSIVDMNSASQSVPDKLSLKTAMLRALTVKVRNIFRI